jgi:hypothetical protein
VGTHPSRRFLPARLPLAASALGLLVMAGGGCFPCLDALGPPGLDLTSAGPVDPAGDGGHDLRPAGPDLARCASNPCDVVCQNCGPGHKCSLDDANHSTCVTTGAAQPGQVCTTHAGNDDCGAGAVCLGVSLAGGSACFRFCHGDGDCAGGASCSIQIAGTPQMVCTEAVTGCSPTPQTGCGAGTACFIIDGQGQTGCHVAGTGSVGATCNSDYDCLAGLSCFQSPGGCQQLCRLASPSDCPNGTACTAVPGWKGSYGACL